MRDGGRRPAVAALAITLLSAVAAAGSAPAGLEAAITGRINAIRAEHGVPPLRPNPALAAVAREHSRRMSRERFFGHDAPAGDSVADRLRAAGLSYRTLGENIARSRHAPDPVVAAVEGWMASAGHRANILRDTFTETGVGVWQDGETYYVTQLFLGGPSE